MRWRFIPAYPEGVSPRPPGRTAPECDGALTRAFGLLGKRWSGVIVGTLQHGPAGFGEIRRSIAGISESMLSDRLAELTATGLVLREVQEGPPIAVNYRLSDRGLALLPALELLADWARDHLDVECPEAG